MVLIVFLFGDGNLAPPFCSYTHQNNIALTSNSKPTNSDIQNSNLLPNRRFDPMLPCPAKLIDGYRCEQKERKTNASELEPDELWF